MQRLLPPLRLLQLPPLALQLALQSQHLPQLWLNAERQQLLLLLLLLLLQASCLKLLDSKHHESRHAGGVLNNTEGTRLVKEKASLEQRALVP